MSRIIVGIDPSEHARRALRWALAQARPLGSQVELVHAFQAPDTGALPGYPRAINEEDVKKVANHVLDDALAEVGDEAEGISIQRSVAVGSPASVLCQAAKEGDLLVIGARGLGGFKGLMVGSVSQQVVAHAPCPVVVVPPARR